MTDEELADARPSGPLIAVEDLELSFGRTTGLLGRQVTRVLDKVSLTIGGGEIVAVVGESGSGKTTLGKAILRLYEPKGRILYRGRNLAVMNERQLRPFRRDLQMVFQDPLSSFNPRFRIASSVALPLLLHGVARDKEDALRLARTLLEQVGLDPDYGGRFPHELSGGQLQRVAIARVLGVSPKLIVADEAVSKLDVSVRAQILNLIKRTNRSSGIAFLFITHDLAVARFLSDRIAVMYGGRIVEIGETKTVFTRPQHPYTVSLMNARKQEDVLPEADNASIAIVGDAACGFAPRCPRQRLRCLQERPLLDLQESEQAVACFYPMGIDQGVASSRSSEIRQRHEINSR